MEILSVQNLCKHYEKFDLKNVSFSLEEGYIMGFIVTNAMVSVEDVANA